MENQIIYRSYQDEDAPSIQVQFTSIVFWGQPIELLDIIVHIEREITLMMAHEVLNDPQFSKLKQTELNNDLRLAQTVFAMHMGMSPPKENVTVSCLPLPNNTCGPKWGFFMAHEFKSKNQELTYIEWVASINNILFANGHQQPIDDSEVDHELAWGMGFKPEDIAYAILNKPAPPKPEPKPEHATKRWSLKNFLKWGWLDNINDVC